MSDAHLARANAAQQRLCILAVSRWFAYNMEVTKSR
jgi:hypothetical protein